MALEEQMAMNFGDVPDNTIGVDPVSGNDIPMGSTAENVRDDIPTMLSEGEIVIPADVVNFHGVKLFEDLRAEAKVGYAQMANDGRIGGQPMDDNVDMGMNISLTLEDLETSDDAEPVQMNRGGTSMADYKDVAKNRDIKPAKRTAPRKTHEEIMASVRGRSDRRDSSPEAISARVQARKDDPKNRYEKLRNRFRDLFDDDDDDKPKSRAKLDFGFGGNPMERAARKYGSPSGAGQVDAPFTVNYREQPFFKALVQNLKEELGFDEGGLIEDTNLIGGEDQFNEGPYYSQKGGFDMDNAYADSGTGTSGPVLEMREYMNDAGHRIFITFIDGVPQMEIPEGYYPVEGEGTVVATTPPIGGGGGSDMGDSGSGTDMPTPEAVNYKELSMEELTGLIEDQKTLGSKFIKNINPLVRIAMWDQTRRTKAEIERRLSDPATSEVDKIRLRNLLELANRDEPGLIKTLLDKVTGSTLETAAGQIPDPKVPDVDFDDPTEAYTPEEQEASTTTTPGVDQSIPQSVDADDFDKMQDQFDIQRIEQEMKAQPRPAPKTADKPIRQESDRVQQARRNTQKVMKDMRDRGASREERTEALKAAARTENVLRDLDRGVVRGFEKGGLVDKPAVKKVVKGLKKASKSHAKQADQLEKAMKKKSK